MEKYIIYGLSAQNIPNYDCSVMHRTKEEWYASGVVNIPLGIAFIFFGVSLYMLCMAAMWRLREKNSCYVIMLLLGFYDIVNIFFSSTLSGTFWLLGASYCTHPDLMYVSGSLTLAAWCCASLCCLILVLNRLCDLWNTTLHKRLFSSFMMWFWMFVTLVYGLYFIFFTTPVLFNSALGTWFLCPFIQGSREEITHFYNFAHSFNNMCVVFGTCLLYVVLIFVLGHKYGLNGINNINKFRRSIILQSILICLASQITASLYVYAQFFPIPSWLIYVAHLLWQFANGIPVVIYLTLNKTIRNEVKRMVGIGRIVQVSVSNSNQGPPTVPSRNQEQTH